ncbi:MAG: DUF1570 domain-containing protein [Planctomycetota bacterium]
MARLLLFLAALVGTYSSAALAVETLAVAPDIYAPQATKAVDADAAAELLTQAKQAADAGRVSTALQLATQALEHDPDEPTCRHVLGYEHIDGQWLTAFQQRQIRRGLVWDARYGWLKSEDLPRYEAGERRDGRRWFIATEDAKRHTTIADGWQVRTDNFQVTTNHSLEAAASLAAELEQLFQVWRQLFAGYHLGDDEVRARFAGTKSARVRAKPMNVIYHRDESGYVAALRHKQPRIAETLGIYFDDLREAHFYAAGDATNNDSAFRATLYHEAVHQLFQESQRTKRGVGSKHNFWAVEGVATYFESLVLGDEGTFTIGGPNAGRLPSARRQLAEGKLVPFGELASLGMADLQRRADLPAVYSQMAGMATYLMHTGDGQHREAFVRYLRDLYTGRAKSASLWNELGESAEAVQLDYVRWLQRLPN